MVGNEVISIFATYITEFSDNAELTLGKFFDRFAVRNTTTPIYSPTPTPEIDPDERYITTNEAVKTSIYKAKDRDEWYFYGEAGQKVTIQMTAISSSLDPTLSIASPSGHGTWDNNSGGGIDDKDARIKRWSLPETGIYTIDAAGRGNSVGDYSLTLELIGGSASADGSFNPTPTP